MMGARGRLWGVAAALALVAGATSTPGKYFGVDSHVDSECLNKDAPDKYLVLVHAHEQMNKNIAVVAEVASWARELGRTFVEPVYCGSRLVLPFDSAADSGEARSSFLALRKKKQMLPNYDYEDCDERKIPLGSFHDVRQACRRVPMVRARVPRALASAQASTAPRRVDFGLAPFFALTSVTLS